MKCESTENIPAHVVDELSFDFNNCVGGPKVPAFLDGFQAEAEEFAKSVWKYAAQVVEIEGGEKSEGDKSQPLTRPKKRVLPPMKRSPAGFPMLPKRADDEDELQHKKDLVRGFLNEHYGKLHSMWSDHCL